MNALDDIAAERRRQIEAEGWTPEHDDGHRDFELARAAAYYAIRTAADVHGEPSEDSPSDRYSLIGAADTAWPWRPLERRYVDFNPRRNLIKAAALLVAEIERLDREPRP